MPCFDTRGDSSNCVLEERRITELDKEVSNLQAGLCAIFSELERRGIADSVITKATESGVIDIISIWIRHKEDDDKRLLLSIKRQYSNDELEVIKRLLHRLDNKG